MAWGMTDQQKLAEQAAREEQTRAQQQQQAQAAYAASPMGRAEAAYRNGDGFFQLELPVNQFQKGKIRLGGALGGILGQIESVGWHLEHTGYVFLQTDSSTTNLLHGNMTSHQGQVMGIYLFRRVATGA